MTDRSTGSPASTRRVLVGAAAGALAGFAVATALWLALEPVLDRTDTWVRDLQGLLWNVIPLLTVVGALVGLWVARSWPRRS